MQVVEKIHQHFNQVAGIDPYVVERARALCLGYFYKWGTPYTTLGIEVPFRLPLLSPETGQPLEGYKPYTGIIDWCFRTDNGKTFFCDRKTTSRCGPDYWDKLKTDAQLSRYYLAAHQAGVKIDGFLWDVIVKPSLSVTDLTKNNILEIQTGHYCGLPITEPTTVEWKDKETPHLHGLKVLAKCIKDADSVYQQRVLYRHEVDLVEYWQDMVTIQSQQQAITCREGALRNRGNCTQFGKTCQFLSICANEDPELTGFRTKAKREDDGAATFAGGVSITAEAEFLSCQRKWWLNRKENLEPLYQQADDTTDLGTLVHSGLEIVARATMSPNETFRLPTGEVDE